MEGVQLNFVIITLMAAYLHVESHQITQIAPLLTRSDANSAACPLEIVRNNTLEKLKNTVRAKLSGSSSSITTESPPAMLLQSQLFGGTGGGYFDDYIDINNITGIVGMSINAGIFVDSIEVTYRLKDGNNYTAPMRGGPGGADFSFTLADGEKLTRMEGITDGMFIFILKFYSNLNNVYGPYGRLSQMCTQFSVAATEIIAFFGRVGGILDAIGVYYTN